MEDKLADGQKMQLISRESHQIDGEHGRALAQRQIRNNIDENFARQALEENKIVVNVSKEDMKKSLLQLLRKSRADIQEGGTNTLFLALGLLKWHQANRAYRAPLILLPVQLEKPNVRARMKLKHHEDDPIFNLTLIEMLRNEFYLDLGELSGDLPRDDSGIDVNSVWQTVRQKIQDMQGFEVVEELVLSTFSFAKHLMWKDLVERTDNLRECSFVEHLIDTPQEAYAHGAKFIEPREVDKKTDELFLPLNADSSQIIAVQASTQEGDFVLEGPPGTGKSETIGNIIAHNLATGKKVLFVSEKMAALEVVQSRLKAIGLGEFCLELHSNKSNRREFLRQLKSGVGSPG